MGLTAGTVQIAVALVWPTRLRAGIEPSCSRAMLGRTCSLSITGIKTSEEQVGTLDVAGGVKWTWSGVHQRGEATTSWCAAHWFGLIVAQFQ